MLIQNQIKPVVFNSVHAFLSLLIQNFKQKGGFFGDCTSLITNIQSEFQTLIEKSSFDNSLLL